MGGGNGRKPEYFGPLDYGKQEDAPDPIINTCNGFYCDQSEPNAYYKPKLWTENWTGWFRQWGARVPHRPVEDIAYAVGRFFQKGGSFMNYYMYHGGTNFDRTAAHTVATSYDYDAPVDEFGVPREPKYSHLRALHEMIKLCIPALAAVDSEPLVWTLGDTITKYNVPLVEITLYVDSIEGRDFGGVIPLAEIIEEATVCAAFIANNGLDDMHIDFNGHKYFTPAWSVSILPNCRSVWFNTARVAAQTVQRKMVSASAKRKNSTSQKASEGSEAISATSRADDKHATVTNVPSASNFSTQGSDSGDGQKRGQSHPRLPQFQSFHEPVGAWGNTVVRQSILDQLVLTDDHTDYLWYTTNVLAPQPVSKLHYGISSASQPIEGHYIIFYAIQDIARVFVNGEHSLKYGSLFKNYSGIYQPLALRPGTNSIAILCVMNALKYGGAFYDVENGGLIGSVTLTGPLFTNDLDLTQNEWTHQVGFRGEYYHLERGTESQEVGWRSGMLLQDQPLVWYKARVEAPQGDNPVALDLGGMRKGQAFVNGRPIGHFWPAITIPSDGCDDVCDYRGFYRFDKKCLSDCGNPAQRLYHIPRDWLLPEDNLLVVFEELGGDPTSIQMLTFDQVEHTVCSKVFNDHPVVPSMSVLTEGKGAANQEVQTPAVNLDCGHGYKIAEIEFASYGDPSGKCGSFATGTCHVPQSAQVVQQACVGPQHCTLSVSNTTMDVDHCPRKVKSLAVQARCHASDEITKEKSN